MADPKLKSVPSWQNLGSVKDRAHKGLHEQKAKSAAKPKPRPSKPKVGKLCMNRIGKFNDTGERNFIFIFDNPEFFLDKEMKERCKVTKLKKGDIIRGTVCYSEDHTRMENGDYTIDVYVKAAMVIPDDLDRKSWMMRDRDPALGDDDGNGRGRGKNKGPPGMLKKGRSVVDMLMAGPDAEKEDLDVVELEDAVPVDTVTITVDTLWGEKVELEVKEYYTIEEVKRAFSQEYGIPMDKVRFDYNGEKLKDGKKKLSDYGITAESENVVFTQKDPVIEDLMADFEIITNFKDHSDAKITEALGHLEGLAEAENHFISANLGIEPLMDLIKFKSKKVSLNDDEVTYLSDAIRSVGFQLMNPEMASKFDSKEGLQMFKDLMALHHPEELMMVAILDSLSDLVKHEEGKDILFNSGAFATMTQSLMKHPEYAYTLRQYGALLAGMDEFDDCFEMLFEDTAFTLDREGEEPCHVTKIHKGDIVRGNVVYSKHNTRMVHIIHPVGADHHKIDVYVKYDLVKPVKLNVAGMIPMRDPDLASLKLDTPLLTTSGTADTVAAAGVNTQLDPMISTKSNNLTLAPLTAQSSVSASIPNLEDNSTLMKAYPGTPTAGMAADPVILKSIPAKLNDGDVRFPKLLQGLVDHGLLQLLDNGLVTNYDSEAAATCLLGVIDQVLAADPELKIAEGLADSVQRGMLLSLHEVGKMDGMDDVVLAKILNTTVSMVQCDPSALDYFKAIDEDLMDILKGPKCSNDTVLAIQEFVDNVKVAEIDLDFNKTNGALGNVELFQPIVTLNNFKNNDDIVISEALAILKGMVNEPDFTNLVLNHGGFDALLDLITFKSKKAILSKEEVEIIKDALSIVSHLLKDPEVVPKFDEKDGMKTLKSVMAMHHPTEPVVVAVMDAFADLATTPAGKQKLYKSGAWVTITEILNKHPEYAGVIQQYGALLSGVPADGPVFPTLLQELVEVGLLPVIQDGLQKNYRSPETVHCLLDIIDQVTTADPKLNIAVGLAHQNTKGLSKCLTACARYKNMDVPILAKILETVVTLHGCNPEAMDYYSWVDGSLAKVLKQKPLPDDTIPTIRDFMAKVDDHNIDLKLIKTESMLNTLETPLVMSPEARLKLNPVASVSTASSAQASPFPATTPATPESGTDFPATNNTESPSYKVSMSDIDGNDDDVISKEERERINANKWIFNRFHVRSLTLHVPMFIYATCALPLWWMDQGANSHSFHSGWSLSRLSIVLIWLASLFTIFEQILEIMDHKETMHGYLEAHCKPLLKRMYLVWICLFLYLSGAFLYFCSGCIVAIAYNEIGIYANEAIAGMWWTEMCFISIVAAFLGFDIWIHIWNRWEVRVTSILIIYAFCSLIAMCNAFAIGDEQNVTGTGYLFGFLVAICFLFHRLMLLVGCCRECHDYSRMIEMICAVLILLAVFITVIGYILYGATFPDGEYTVNYLGYAQFQMVFGVIIAMDLFFSEYMVIEKGICKLVITKDQVTKA